MLIPAIDPKIYTRRGNIFHLMLISWWDSLSWQCRGNDSAQLKFWCRIFFSLKQVSSENQMSTSHQQSCLNTSFCCVNFPSRFGGENHEIMTKTRLYSQIIQQLLACGRTCGCHFLYHYQHKLWCVQWAYSLRVHVCLLRYIFIAYFSARFIPHTP